MPDKTEEILVHLEYIRKAQDETTAHLRAVNGRVGKSEIRLAILETRSDDAKTAGAKWGAGVGAMVTSIILGLWQYMQGGAK